MWERMTRLMAILMAPDGDGGGGGGAEGDGGKGGDDGKGGDGGEGDGGKKADEGDGGKKKDSGAEGDGKKGSEGDDGKGGDDGADDGKGGKRSETGKKKSGDDKGANDGPPEKYDLRSPETWDHFDEADIKAVEEVARREGWSNEEAQRRLDEHADTLAEQSERFKAETKADKAIGGDKLDETLTLSKRALDGLYPKGTSEGDEMRALLDRTGYANHRVIIRHFRMLAERMGEDLPTGSGRGTGGTEVSQADKLYDGKGNDAEG